jgi:hypothetical protein
LAAEDEGLRCPQHLDWILAGRDDSLAIDARYAARGGWRAGILDFIDRYQVDVIHVNHAFEMLLAVRIRELVFRRTGRIPRVICDTHDVQAKTYAKRSAENPFNKQQDRYSELLESETLTVSAGKRLNPLLKW